MRLKTLFFSLLLILPLSSGMAHGSASDTATRTILMGEMYFQIEGQAKTEPLKLQAGQPYELIFKNIGAMKHEVLFGRELIKRNGIAKGYQEHLLQQVEVEVEIELQIDGQQREIEVETFGLKELELEPGTQVSISFTLPELSKGTWEMGCFISGHYEAGMWLPLIVE